MNDQDRVRENTSEEINKEIEREFEKRITKYAGKSKAEISMRIDELDREWDIERVLETNASILALSGLALGATHDKKWFILPGVVMSFLLQHAVQGWCPPVPLFRRLGIRTRKEIDREKYALKYLRGDFKNSDSEPKPEEALEAVRA